MPSKSKVCLFYLGTKFSLTKRFQLKEYVQYIFKNEGKKLESVNYIFCTDNALLDINRKYLKHDFYTDIITFDLSDEDKIVAEIYISIDRVRENARNIGVSFNSEIHRIILHGALHLCGYNDKTKSEKDKIRSKEDFYLNKYILKIA
jgi:rRNA maturation RNase YbeY